MYEQINAAIQVLPRATEIHPYAIVDKAIETIAASGLKYQVCPFETVIEGSYHEVMELIKRVHETCYNAGAEELICNIKIQTSGKQNVSIDDKMHKYRS